MIKNFSAPTYSQVVDLVNDFLITQNIEVISIKYTTNFSKTLFDAELNYSPIPHVRNITFSTGTTTTSNSVEELQTTLADTIAAKDTIITARNATIAAQNATIEGLNSDKASLITVVNAKGYEAADYAAALGEVTDHLPVTTRTITFNSNGGSAVEPIVQTYGTIASAPIAPTLAGSVFGGWYMDNETFLIAFPFTDAITASFTLYAKWTLEG